MHVGGYCEIRSFFILSTVFFILSTVLWVWCLLPVHCNCFCWILSYLCAVPRSVTKATTPSLFGVWSGDRITSNKILGKLFVLFTTSI